MEKREVQKAIQDKILEEIHEGMKVYVTNEGLLH